MTIAPTVKANLEAIRVPDTRVEANADAVIKEDQKTSSKIIEGVEEDARLTRNTAEMTCAAEVTLGEDAHPLFTLTDAMTIEAEIRVEVIILTDVHTNIHVKIRIITNQLVQHPLQVNQDNSHQKRNR